MYNVFEQKVFQMKPSNVYLVIELCYYLTWVVLITIKVKKAPVFMYTQCVYLILIVLEGKFFHNVRRNYSTTTTVAAAAAAMVFLFLINMFQVKINLN